MAELGNKVSKEGISRLIGWQYLFAPGKCTTFLNEKVYIEAIFVSSLATFVPKFKSIT